MYLRYRQCCDLELMQEDRRWEDSERGAYLTRYVNDRCAHLAVEHQGPGFVGGWESDVANPHDWGLQSRSRVDAHG